MKYIIVFSLILILAGCSRQKRELEIALVENQRVSAELFAARNAAKQVESATTALKAELTALQKTVDLLRSENAARDQKLQLLGESEGKLRGHIYNFLEATAASDSERAMVQLGLLMELLPEVKAKINASRKLDATKQPETRVRHHDDRFISSDLKVQLFGARWKSSIGIGKADVYQPWLVVTISISNAGKKPLQVPTLQLVDPSGSTYDMDSLSFLMPGGVRVLQQINPNTFETVFAAFKAPRGLDYKLGFMWEGDAQLITVKAPE